MITFMSYIPLILLDSVRCRLSGARVLVSAWGSDRTGAVMAELEIDQSNLPRVQEGKSTLLTLAQMLPCEAAPTEWK